DGERELGTFTEGLLRDLPRRRRDARARAPDLPRAGGEDRRGNLSEDHSGEVREREVRVEVKHVGAARADPLDQKVDDARREISIPLDLLRGSPAAEEREQVEGVRGVLEVNR